MKAAHSCTAAGPTTGRDDAWQPRDKCYRHGGAVSAVYRLLWSLFDCPAHWRRPCAVRPFSILWKLRRCCCCDGQRLSPFLSWFTSSSTSQLISVIISTLVIHHSSLSLQAQNLPFQQILPTVDLFLPTGLPHDNGTGPDLLCSSFYF